MRQLLCVLLPLAFSLPFFLPQVEQVRYRTRAGTPRAEWACP